MDWGCGSLFKLCGLRRIKCYDPHTSIDHTWHRRVNGIVSLHPVLPATHNIVSLKKNKRQIFRIGTMRYAEGLWRMRRHGPVTAHYTDLEDFPIPNKQLGWRPRWPLWLWALSKTCWTPGWRRDSITGRDARTAARTRRRDSSDTVLSQTIFQWAVITLQPSLDDVAALLKPGRQSSVQHHMLFRTIWRRANSVSTKDKAN